MRIQNVLAISAALLTGEIATACGDGKSEVDTEKPVEQTVLPKKLSLNEIINQIDCKTVTTINDTDELTDNQLLELLKCRKIQKVDLTIRDDSIVLKIYLPNGETIKHEVTLSFGKDLQKYLLKERIDVRSVTPTDVTFLITALLPAMAVLAMLLIVMEFAKKTGILGGKFKPVTEQPKVSFNDIGGLEHIKTELLELVQEIKNREAIIEKGGEVPHGILFVGPPGNGKTLTARAIAKESDVPFMYASGADLISMWAGHTSEQIRNLFKEARKEAQKKGACIIFIDELDAIGSSRSKADTALGKEQNAIVNQLLVEIDGFEPTDGVFVIAASNYPENLDNALVRQGRFGRKITFTNPYQKGRLEILRILTHGLQFDPDVRFESVASALAGRSGAEVAAVVKEAKSLAAKRNGEEAVLIIKQEDFSKAIDRILIGMLTDVVLSPDEQKIAAYHEAGHAVTGLRDPNTTVERVGIIPRGETLGATLTPPYEERAIETKSQLIWHIKMLLAGILSERMFLKEGSTGAINDLKKATELSIKMVADYGMAEPDDKICDVRSYELQDDVTDNAINALMIKCKQETEKLLGENAALLHAIAERLIANRTIEYKELMELAAAHGLNAPNVAQ